MGGIFGIFGRRGGAGAPRTMRTAATRANTTTFASLTDRDVQRLRKETPGTKKVKHLNNAGCALPPQPVLDASVALLKREAEIGGYEACAEAEPQLQRTYQAIAEMLGAPDPGCIGVVPSATVAWQQAFFGLAAGFKEGDRILTCRAEYGSNYINYLQACKRSGCVVEAVPDDEHGQIDVKALESMVDERTKLISISHVPTSTGLVQPAAAVGKVARAAGVPYLLDACQSFGQMPLDVRELGCDFLTATSRKYLRGPRGAGFIYASPEVLESAFEPATLDVRGATWTSDGEYERAPGARCFESYEMSVAASVGMGVAAEYALGVGVAAGWERIQSLSATLRRLLSDIPGVEVADRGEVRCGIVSFSKARCKATEIRDALRRYDINVSVSPVSSTRLDLGAREVREDDAGDGAVVRASVHYYNTEQELFVLAKIVNSFQPS